MTKKFQDGKTYATRSAADYDTIFAFTIIRRTDKSVWINVRGKTVRRTIRVVDGVETIDPMGRYSMSPVISADKTEADVYGSEDPSHECTCEVSIDYEDARCLTCGGWLQGPADLEDEPAPVTILPLLRPYQIEALKLIEHPRSTAPAVEALKQSSEIVAGQVRFDNAVRFITRFCEQIGKPVSRENVQFVLDLIAGMDDENFDDLDFIRQYLRGE